MRVREIDIEQYRQLYELLRGNSVKSLQVFYLSLIANGYLVTNVVSSNDSIYQDNKLIFILFGIFFSLITRWILDRYDRYSAKYHFIITDFEYKNNLYMAIRYPDDKNKIDRINHKTLLVENKTFKSKKLRKSGITDKLLGYSTSTARIKILSLMLYVWFILLILYVINMSSIMQKHFFYLNISI